MCGGMEGGVKRSAEEASLGQGGLGGGEPKKQNAGGLGMEGGVALRAAAAQGMDADVARLIGGGAPVNGEDAEGRTALSFAVEGGHSGAVAVLIKAGADLEKRAHSGDLKTMTPLILASAKGHTFVVQQLLEGGADWKATMDGGFTALKAAQGIEACATALRVWEAKHAPAASAPVKPEQVPRQAPVQQQPPPQQQQQVPQKQLKVEDALGYLERVKTTFASNPKVYSDFLDIMKDFKNKSIDTPGVIRRVSQLFGHAHTELILQFNTFLPVGYKIDAADLNDPSHAAFCPIQPQQLVKQPPQPITQQPLAKPALPPAPPSVMPQQMPTQTVSAAWLRRNEFVASSYGRATLAEPEASAAGWPLTPPVEPIQPPLIELHMAAKNSDDKAGEAAVSKMIAQGVDVNIEDVEGRTALFFASEHGRDATVGALLKAPNVALNKQDRIGRTPLMAAAINGRANAVTALLKAGADWKLAANGGFYEKKTALDCAEHLKQKEVVRAFEQWKDAKLQQLKPQAEKKEAAPEKERVLEKPKVKEAATSAPPAAAPAAAPDAETKPKASDPADTPAAVKTEPKPTAESSAEQSAPPTAAAATMPAAPAKPSAAVKTEVQPSTAAEAAADEDPAAV